MAKRTKPRWNCEGQPMNLEACARDALDWLQLARNKDLVGALNLSPRVLGEARAAIGRCADALAAGLRGEFAREVARDAIVVVDDFPAREEQPA